MNRENKHRLIKRAVYALSPPSGDASSGTATCPDLHQIPR